MERKGTKYHEILPVCQHFMNGSALPKELIYSSNEKLSMTYDLFAMVLK